MARVDRPPAAALKLSVSADAAAVPAVRRSADGLASALVEDASGRLRLLISELVSNAVLHGAGTESGPLQVGVFISKEKIRVEVTDTGGGLAAPTPAADPEREGGYGLRLVEALADRWGSKLGDEHTLWFELDAS